MHASKPSASCLTSCALLLSLAFTPSLFAQDSSAPASPAATPAPTQSDSPTKLRDRSHTTQAQNLDEAWTMLSTALADTKHAEARIQALAAIGNLGSNPRSSKMIARAMDDPDVDVRTAAILAAGESKDRNLTTDLRTMLDDKEPQVAFAAASTLWKMNDRSGEDILLAIIDGERSANPKFVHGTMHNVSKQLHNPAGLARLGALQGASMLLGPFGFGITAFEYMRKNGGDSARVVAIEQVAQQKNGPIRAELLGALNDKDLGVRAAAAKALGTYHDKTIATALFPLFDDAKQPVRLTAAAAYINSVVPMSSNPKRTTPKKP